MAQWVRCWWSKWEDLSWGPQNPRVVVRVCNPSFPYIRMGGGDGNAWKPQESLRSVSSTPKLEAGKGKGFMYSFGGSNTCNPGSLHKPDL